MKTKKVKEKKEKMFKDACLFCGEKYELPLRNGFALSVFCSKRCHRNYNRHWGVE